MATNSVILATAFLAVYGQESCDNYVDHNGNWYWETVPADGYIASYCRLVHCILESNSGVVESSWRRDEETSETQINTQCETDCVFADWTLPPNDFCACPSCPEVTTSVPCTDDSYECADGTILSTQDETTCRFQCIDDNYCTTNVCCDDELMTECDAMEQCDGEIIPHNEIVCTPSVFTCPDGHSTISAGECCGFNYADCCVEECHDGSIIQGTYTLHGEDFVECSMPHTCDDCVGETIMSCPDGTTINLQDNCEFASDSCCVMECSSGVVLQGGYEEGECVYANQCQSVSTEEPESTEEPGSTEISDIGCTEEAMTCSDNTVLVRSAVLDCALNCPDTGCDSSVCCNDETMSECQAINECTDGFQFGDCQSGTNSFVISVGILMVSIVLLMCN